MNVDYPELVNYEVECVYVRVATQSVYRVRRDSLEKPPNLATDPEGHAYYLRWLQGLAPTQQFVIAAFKWTDHKNNRSGSWHWRKHGTPVTRFSDEDREKDS